MPETIERVILKEGKTYRVLKAGCRLTRTVSIHADVLAPTEEADHD